MILLYAIWSLLNIGLFIYFLYLVVFAIKAIDRSKGRIASILFGFMLLGLIYTPKAEHATHQEWTISNANSKMTNKDTLVIPVTLESRLFFSNILQILYLRDSLTQYSRAVKAISYSSGFTKIFEWEGNSVDIKTTKSNRFHYDINGTLKWQLLGVTFFFQHKRYTGIVP